MLKWGKSHRLAGGGSLQPPDYFCSTSGCIRGRASKLLGGIRQLLTGWLAEGLPLLTLR